MLVKIISPETVRLCSPSEAAHAQLKPTGLQTKKDLGGAKAIDQQEDVSTCYPVHWLLFK